jgi:hypothetical protein
LPFKGIQTTWYGTSIEFLPVYVFVREDAFAAMQTRSDGETTFTWGELFSSLITARLFLGYSSEEG